MLANTLMLVGTLATFLGTLFAFLAVPSMSGALSLGGQLVILIGLWHLVMRPTRKPSNDRGKGSDADTDHDA